jgi:septum formation protein
LIASVETYGLSREVNAAFLQGLYDFRRGRFFIIVGYDQGVSLRRLELYNAVYLFEDRTYPRLRISGVTFGDGQLHGLFSRKGRLRCAREPRNQAHQQDGQDNRFPFHESLLRVLNNGIYLSTNVAKIQIKFYKAEKRKVMVCMGLQLSAPFILASASPRRIELLTLLGLDFTVMPSGADETFRPGESPPAHTLRLSADKAGLIAVAHPGSWVLGADTIVVIDGTVLGKPADPEEARRMLKKLSARSHTVFTGFTLVRQTAQIAVSEVVASTVLFREIAEDEMAWYINSPEPYDKAGAYAVQGIGAFFIKEIKGSYTNVMGLPLCEVVDLLKKVGAIKFAV